MARAGGKLGAAQQKPVGHTGGGCGFDVGAAVAHKHGCGEIKTVFLCRLKQHARFGLAAFAITTVVANAVLGVERRKVNGVQASGLLRKRVAHGLHESVELRLGVEAAADACLVGNDDDGHAKRVGGADQIGGTRDEADVFELMKIAGFFVDDAVAVEKERGPQGIGHTAMVAAGAVRRIAPLDP